MREKNKCSDDSAHYVADFAPHERESLLLPADGACVELSAAIEHFRFKVVLAMIYWLEKDCAPSLSSRNLLDQSATS